MDPVNSGDAISASAQEAASGGDVSLIRWMLSLTPRERLQVLQAHVNSIMRLRDALRPVPDFAEMQNYELPG